MKKMVKRISIAVFWVALVAGTFCLLSFTQAKQNATPVNKVAVFIENTEEAMFIDPPEVKQLALDHGDRLDGQLWGTVNPYDLERLFNEHPAVEQSQVVKHLNGSLSIRIRQRRPIARLMNSAQEGFYLDQLGRPMPLFSKSTARVPVFSGAFSASYARTYFRHLATQTTFFDSLSLSQQLLESFFRIAHFIDRSPFWRAQIQQVYYDGHKLYAIPLAGEHRIVLGDANRIEEKFAKLMVMYKRGFPLVGWNRYSEINLEYAGQVVCKKSPAFQSSLEKPKKKKA